MSDIAVSRLRDALVILSAIAATIALGLALTHAGDVTASRRDSARDSCHLLRGLVFAATTRAPKQRAAAAAYIARTKLHDCNEYAHALLP